MIRSATYVIEVFCAWLILAAVYQLWHTELAMQWVLATTIPINATVIVANIYIRWRMTAPHDGKPEPLWWDLFYYGAEFGTIGAGESKRQTLHISVEAVWEWQTIRTASDCTKYLYLMVVDNGSGRQLFSKPLAVDTLAKNPHGRRFRQGSSIELTVHNMDSAAHDCSITLGGRKIFPDIR